MILRRRILHLVGSPTSAFYLDLSLVYARGCIGALADPARYDFVIALVGPDGSWRFPASLSVGDIAAAEVFGLAGSLSRLASLTIDVALPQMFCPDGMTTYRALLELLAIPYIGNRPLQMGVTADKAMARAIVAAAGVSVPQAQLLRRGETPTLALPVVVKPNASDNSDGITLVTDTAQIGAAITDARQYSDTVLVERYVELGREVRCAMVERDGALILLPLEEYFVDPVHRPVRTRAHKLRTDAANGLALAAKAPDESWIVADDDPVVAAVGTAALRCHIALGCRHYSLFDFRIDPKGQPWFLEAGLYCSFSPQSVVATMASASGWPLEAFFAAMVEQVIAEAERSAG